MLDSVGGVITGTTGEETNMFDPIVGSLIIGGLSAGAGILQNQTNAEAVEATNEANLQATRETNAQNRALTHEAWARDDNAVQRRTADLRAAGMSPLLAAGSSAGNTNPATMSAPQFAAKKYDYSQLLNGINQGMALARSTADQEAVKVQIALNEQQRGINLQDAINRTRLTQAQIDNMKVTGKAQTTSADASMWNASTHSKQQALEQRKWEDLQAQRDRDYLTSGFVLDRMIQDYRNAEQTYSHNKQKNAREWINTGSNFIRTATGAGAALSQ